MATFKKTTLTYASAYKIGEKIRYRSGSTVYSGTVEGIGHNCVFVASRNRIFKVYVDQIITAPNSPNGNQSKPSDVALCNGPGQSSTGKPWGL